MALFSKKLWKNGSAGGTPLDADGLNDLEARIASIDLTLPDAAIAGDTTTLTAAQTNVVTGAGPYPAPAVTSSFDATKPQRFAIRNAGTATVKVSFPNVSGTTVTPDILPGEARTYRQASASGYALEQGIPLTQLDARFLKPGDVTDATAADVPVTPGGILTATNVQAALLQLRDLLFPKTLADAKGDTFAASGDDVVVRVAVGTDGQVLTADAASAAGVKWATPAASGASGETWLGMVATALTTSAVSAVGAAGRAHPCRATRGSSTVATKLGFNVGTQSGNVMLSARRPNGTGSAARPDALVATTGVVACPAGGYQELALQAGATLAPGDYFELWADNVTATFGVAAAGNTVGGKFQACYYDYGTGVTTPPANLSAGSTVGYNRVYAITAVA